MAEKPVGIELTRGQRTAQARRGAEAHVGLACEFQPALVRTDHEFRLLQLRRRGIDLQLAGQPPRRIGQRGRRARLRRRRPCDRKRAVEPRQRIVEMQDAVEIGGERPHAGLDVQPQPLADAVGGPSGGNAKWIAHAVRFQDALPAHGAGESAHLAGENDVVEPERGAARGVVQHHRAGDMKLVDGERAEIEPAGTLRPGHASALIEAELEHQAVQRQLVGAPLAAHQVAERELDLELLDADIVGVAAPADGDLAQPQRRRRQQPRVDLAVDAYRHADDARSLTLELRPELAPVDEEWADQGSQQRHDNGDRKSEQRRLHGCPLESGFAPQSRATHYIVNGGGNSTIEAASGRIKIGPKAAPPPFRTVRKTRRSRRRARCPSARCSRPHPDGPEALVSACRW